VTFVLNIVIARSLSVDAYGVSAVQFHLINSSIVFLAREGVRRSCLRSNDDESLIAGSLVAIPAGALLAGVSGAVFYGRGNTAAVMQCVAAFVEVLSEPMYVLSTSKMWFGMRTGCEAVAMIAKNVVSVWLLQSAYFKARMDPVMAVSWGQVVYSVALLVCFSVGMWCMSWSRQRGIKAPTRQFLSLYGTFTFQAMGKLVLAEGSKAVLALVTSPSAQGVYGLVNNLGSLVVRTLFQPFEELVFVTFSKQAGDDGDGRDGRHGRDKESLSHQASMLSGLCHIVAVIGGVAACFGPSYSYVALRVLYGERWASSEAPRALGMYSIYVALLAMNGTLEAFLHGVADRGDLLKNNVALIVASLAHMGLSVAAVRSHGAVGLLVADGINMMLRIVYSCVFVNSYFRGVGGIRGVHLLPTGRFLGTLGLAGVLAKASQAVFLGGLVHFNLPLVARMAAHVGVGVSLLGAVLAVAILDVKQGKNGAATLLWAKKKRE
jgi:oligosaccharide translocation protein RFT1